MAAAFETGAEVLPGAPAYERSACADGAYAGGFAQNAGVQGGIRCSTQLFDFLNPALRFMAPAQTVCNYATLLSATRRTPSASAPTGSGPPSGSS